MLETLQLNLLRVKSSRTNFSFWRLTQWKTLYYWDCFDIIRRPLIHLNSFIYSWFRLLSGLGYMHRLLGQALAEKRPKFKLLARSKFGDVRSELSSNKLFCPSLLSSFFDNCCNNIICGVECCWTFELFVFRFKVFVFSRWNQCAVHLNSN